METPLLPLGHGLHRIAGLLALVPFSIHSQPFGLCLSSVAAHSGLAEGVLLPGSGPH